MTVIATALAPIFILILMGFILRHRRLIAEEFWLPCEKLNYFYLFPALMFSQIANADFAGFSLCPCRCARQLFCRAHTRGYQPASHHSRRGFAAAGPSRGRRRPRIGAAYSARGSVLQSTIVKLALVPLATYLIGSTISLRGALLGTIVLFRHNRR